ncbi:MAG: phage replisome organizer N-terminal domain-containing protein [Desulfobulbus sp.]|nr:phage replisome organizer N-terminal domain-containing protein [Desulfobulbus sp.]
MEWVKVRCDLFDHRKIKLIRKGPRGDTLVLLWVMLIAEAGKCGRGGALMISENTPYTAETLSLLLTMPESVIEQGLELFARLEMIERDEVIWIRNWRKYQSEDKLEVRREKDRLRQQRHREKAPEMSQPVSRDSHASPSRDVTQENRTEKNRVEKTTTTEGVRLLLSQTPLSNISDQELGGLMQRHGPGRLRQAADVAAETWRRDRVEIRNPGGYLNTLCETLIIPDWYAPPEERQKRAQETRRRQEVQAAGLVAQQMAEEIENRARDQLWQSLSDTERDQFCTVARDEYPVGTHAPEGVVQILAKMKAWEARQVSGCS